MKTILIVGSLIVTLALILYSIAIITELRKKRATNFVLAFLTAGIVADITATICMIVGSTNSPFTIHGFIGYSALAVMLIDAILLWRFRLANNAETLVPQKLNSYSFIAWAWWVVAYITGSYLAMSN